MILLSIILACTKELPSAPIIEFKCAPNPVVYNWSTTLVWDFKGATDCNINGLAVPCRSTMVVTNVIAPITLTLNGKTKTGTFSKSIDLKVESKVKLLIPIDSLNIGPRKHVKLGTFAGAPSE